MKIGQKYETRQCAEWRVFNAEMHDGTLAAAKEILVAMTDKGNIAEAKKWIEIREGKRKRLKYERGKENGHVKVLRVFAI